MNNYFLSDDYLLENEISKELYHSFAGKLPIIDYHCHINPREIAENRRFDNLTQLWLGGDHYKWRLMRSAGVEESFITGNAPDREKFQKWAETICRAIGNPLYVWTHLELKRYFDYDGILSGETAEEVWQLGIEKLAQEDMSARGIIKRSNVELICTTDDPADTLEWHEKISADKSFPARVLPAWRPDRALNIEKPDFSEYIRRLEELSGVKCGSFEDLKKLLGKRMDFFEAHGCTVSDHGLEYVVYAPAKEAELEQIYKSGLSGETLSVSQIEKYKTALLLFCAEEYSKRGWVMQLHFGCLRDNNKAMFAKIGADTGFDCIGGYSPASELSGFLSAVEQSCGLPKTIIYSLNPCDNALIDSLIGCFQKGPEISLVQHGSAWWFNDNINGMREQLTSLANSGYLAGFVGMLTDSRSFVSYPRHELFRRILCGLLGEWVQKGLFPADIKTLGSIVEDISYYNTKRYFGFDNLRSKGETK